jgi:cellulose biosynthesis protein BcsQ
MVISVANIKGGVGKTTTTINLAEVFSKNKKVLIYDLDRQKASAYFFNINKKGLFKTQNPNIDVYVNSKFEKTDGYEIVLIDTPAGINKPTKKAINTSDIAIVPVFPSILSIRTFNELVDRGFDNLKLLLNGVEKKENHLKIVKLILNLPKEQFFKTYIPKSDILENMPLLKKSVIATHPTSIEAKAYFKLSKEII